MKTVFDFFRSVLDDESAKSERKTKLTLYLACITFLNPLNIVDMKTVFDFFRFVLDNKINNHKEVTTND